jgi:antitoxin component of MazEF toxin-antitoxin module
MQKPQNLTEKFSLAEGSSAELALVNGNLVIKPKVNWRYSLEELVQDITPKTLHQEIEAEFSVGNEVW